MKKLLRRFARWILERTGGMPVGTSPTGSPLIQLYDETYHDKIVSAVHRAYAQVGLPLSYFTLDYDISNTGKTFEVLHHAAQSLGLDHELRTVGDIIAWLEEAPRA